MRRHHFRGVIVFLALLTVANMPLVSTAKPLTASIRIVNNSSRTIRNVYLSHAGSDDWGDNQLGDRTIGSGESFTINLSWDQQQVKVIAENQDGCFLSSVVAVGDNVSWTITNDTAADCGSSSGGSAAR